MGQHSKKWIEENSRFGFGIRDISAENHWREVDEDFSFLGKKTILILPGSGTNSARDANGMCSAIERMLPENLRDKWQICSLHYVNSLTVHEPTVVRAQKLFDNYFVPLIANKNKDGDLERLSAEEAAHNFRNLVVVTHCYGGYIIEEIEKLLKQTMADLGYSEEESAFIQRQLFVAQHNNIDENLGKKESLMTNFVRLSAADEESLGGEMELGSFKHFAQNYEIYDDKVLLTKIAKNTLISWARRITRNGEKEHNGGYWLHESRKTFAGKKEEIVFKAIFGEILSSDYFLEKPEQFINRALRNNEEVQGILFEAVNYGKEFGNDFQQYREKLISGFDLIKDKINDRSLQKHDLDGTDTDVCFMMDDKGRFLIDYAFAKKNYNAAMMLFEKMDEKIPFPDGFGWKTVDSKNKADAVSKTAIWAQRALNADRKELFKLIAKKTDSAWMLDYSGVSDEMMADIVDTVFNPSFYPDSVGDQDEYLEKLLSLYVQYEEKPENECTDIVKRCLEDVVFKQFEKDSYCNQCEILEKCELAGAASLKKKLKPRLKTAETFFHDKYGRF